MVRIGIAGIGKMGAAVAGRLAGLGHEVFAWNRTAAKAQALAPRGVTAVGEAAELVARADTILVLLTDAAAIEAAYHGPRGLLAGPARGRLFIEMSTVRPAVVVALAERVRAAGAAFVESPVGGSVGPASEGKLIAFVGGEPADVARARAVLEPLSRRIEHLGPVGAGASMKLAINLPLLVFYQALGESLTLVRDLGVAPERLMDILGDTSGAPRMLAQRGPQIARQLAGVPVAVTVDVDTVRKDLRTMVEEAAARGFDSPLARTALACYDTVSAGGEGAADCTRLPVAWLERPVKAR